MEALRMPRLRALAQQRSWWACYDASCKPAWKQLALTLTVLQGAMLTMVTMAVMATMAVIVLPCMQLGEGTSGVQHSCWMRAVQRCAPGRVRC